MTGVTMKHLGILVERGPVDGGWLAIVVDHCISTHADRRSDLDLEIAQLLIAHTEMRRELGIDPFDLPPSPDSIRKRFDAATKQTDAWIFTPSRWFLRLVIREAPDGDPDPATKFGELSRQVTLAVRKRGAQP